MKSCQQQQEYPNLLRIPCQGGRDSCPFGTLPAKFAFLASTDLEETLCLKTRCMALKVVLQPLYTRICTLTYVCTRTHTYTRTETCRHVHTYTHNVTHCSLVLDPSGSPQASCCFREAALWSTAPRIHPSILSSASLSAPISGHLCNPAASLCTN